MSYAPSLSADGAGTLLDKGYTVVLYKNAMGQFVAVAAPPGFYSEWVQAAVQSEVAKDHECYGETPEEALRVLVKTLN